MPQYQELVSFIVRKIVTNPEAVQVSTERDGNRVTVQVRADPGDLGKVIGREGRHIEAIRMVARSASLRPRDRVNVEVNE